MKTNCSACSEPLTGTTTVEIDSNSPLDNRTKPSRPNLRNTIKICIVSFVSFILGCAIIIVVQYYLQNHFKASLDAPNVAFSHGKLLTSSESYPSSEMQPERSIADILKSIEKKQIQLNQTLANLQGEIKEVQNLVNIPHQSRTNPTTKKRYSKYISIDLKEDGIILLRFYATPVGLSETRGICANGMPKGFQLVTIDRVLRYVTQFKPLLEKQESNLTFPLFLVGSDPYFHKFIETYQKQEPNTPSLKSLVQTVLRDKMVLKKKKSLNCLLVTEQNGLSIFGTYTYCTYKHGTICVYGNRVLT